MFEFSRQKSVKMANVDFWRKNSNIFNFDINVTRFARNDVKWDFLRDFQTLFLFLAEQLTDWSDNLFPYFLAGYGYFWGSLPPNWNGAKSLRFLHCRRFSSGAKIRRNGGEDPRSKTIHQTGQWNGAENQHRHQRKFQLSSYCKMRHFHEFSISISSRWDPASRFPGIPQILSFPFPDIFAGNWRDKRDGISRKKVPASRFPDFQFPGKKRNTIFHGGH